MKHSELEGADASRVTSRVAMRDSQMELLRIVAMSMILIHHFVCNGVHLYHGVSDEYYLLHLIDALAYYGVNLFVLISGFYGIKVSRRSFLSLLITVIFFTFIDLALACGSSYINGGTVDVRWQLNHTVRFLCNYWFVACYVMLYILSPIINRGLQSLTLTQLRAVVLLTTCYSVYISALDTGVNHNGFTVAHFIYIYILGYWIKTDHPFANLKNLYLVAIALLSSVMMVVAQILSQPQLARCYNSIFLIAGSVALFIMFTRFSFRNRFVNSLAAASLGCYLLQDSAYGWSIYVWQRGFIAAHSIAASVAMFAVTFVAIWTASWLLTRFKNLWEARLVGFICDRLPKRLKRPIW